MPSLLKKRHYFDSGSFTPIHQKAVDAMQAILQIQTKCGMGNPMAIHASGKNAKEYLEQAQTILARQCQIKTGNVVFTSGATEANLIAIRTAIVHAKKRGIDVADMHIIVGNEEHKSIYKHIEFFQTFGMQCTTAAPKDGKQYTPADIAKHIRKNTVAISLQLVNSQHGIIQPIKEITRTCKEKNPLLFIHTDAAQATAYFNYSPVSLDVDVVTIDGTKSFGPQGIGALLFQKAHLYTGLQGEHSIWDIRPGTPSIALIYGFATALHETHKNRKRLYIQAQNARNNVIMELKQHIPDTHIHGIEKNAKEVKPTNYKKIAPHLLYVSFPNTNHLYLATLLDTKGFAVSTGSACNTQADGFIRIGVLPTTTKRAGKALVQCIKKHLAIARKA